MKWNPVGNDRVVICLDIIVEIIRLSTDIELISICQAPVLHTVHNQ